MSSFRATGTKPAHSAGNRSRAPGARARRRTGAEKRDAGWSHFQHVADIGVHGHGPTLAGAFEQAALALTGIVTDPARVRAEHRVRIRCAAPDPELLLADWLNALIFEMATRKMLFVKFTVTLGEGTLEAEAEGEAVDVERHRPVAEPKGATYTGLEVRQDERGHWHARCVVDV